MPHVVPFVLDGNQPPRPGRQDDMHTFLAHWPASGKTGDVTDTGKPLTVLHLTMGAVLGGVTRYICDLTNGLRSRSHRAIAGGAAGPWESLFHQNGIDWVQFPLDGGFASLWRSGAMIRNLVRERSVDIIHCHFRRPLLACRLAQWRGMPHIPVVYTLHLAPIPIGGLSHRLAGFGDQVIAPAEEGRKWAIHQAGVPDGRITLIPHGVDLARWRPASAEERDSARERLGIQGKSAVAAFVGRFEYPKNEQWVLDVAAECRRRNMNVGFILCGDGPNADAVRSRINRDNLTDMIHLTGYVDPLEVYHASDLVLLPSAIEGFGYVAAEAAACGVAVVRTRTAGWQETVQDGETGRVTEIDPAAFVNRSVDLLASPQLLNEMGRAGRVWAERKLDLNHQVEQTLEAYRRMIV